MPSTLRHVTVEEGQLATNMEWKINRELYISLGGGSCFLEGDVTQEEKGIFPIFSVMNKTMAPR